MRWMLLYALASPPADPVDLHWSAPPPCPTDAVVERRIEALVADAPPSGGLAVRAIVDRVGPRRFTAELVIVRAGVETRRSLEAPTCETLAETTSFVAMVTARWHTVPHAGGSIPASVEEVVRPVPEQLPEPPAAPPHAPAQRRPPPTANVVRDVGSSPPETARWALRVELGPAFGPTAKVHGRLAALAGARWRRASAWVGVGYDTARTFERPRTEVGASLWAVTGMLRGCFGPRWNAVALPVCAGLELGAVVGRGRGLRSPRTAVEPWGGGSVSLGPKITVVRDLSLGVELQAVGGFLRPRFEIDDFDDALTRVVPVTGRLVATLGWN